MDKPKETHERRRLEHGMRELGLAVEERVVCGLLEHMGLIRKWAGSYNLVARGDLDALVDRHVLDALCINPWLRGERVLDAGSGAGFPGVPLALVNPEKHFLLLDSAGKRVRFLRHVVRTLGLENVTVSQSRVEEFKHGAPFDTIVSRAFSSLALYAARVGHLAGDLTRMLAIKGRLPSEELAALSPSVKVEAVEAYQVPGLHAERHVVIMSLSSQRS